MVLVASTPPTGTETLMSAEGLDQDLENEKQNETKIALPVAPQKMHY